MTAVYMQSRQNWESLLEHALKCISGSVLHVLTVLVDTTTSLLKIIQNRLTV